jgi:hypothetical protein
MLNVFSAAGHVAAFPVRPGFSGNLYLQIAAPATM